MKPFDISEGLHLLRAFTVSEPFRAWPVETLAAAGSAVLMAESAAADSGLDGEASAALEDSDSQAGPNPAVWNRP